MSTELAMHCQRLPRQGSSTWGTQSGVEQEQEVRLDLRAGERRFESPQRAVPDGVSVPSQVVGPLVAYPHAATPTLDTTDHQDLEDLKIVE